jgi:hypothetical protein
VCTVWVSAFLIFKKKLFIHRVLKPGANEASAQQYQNMLYNGGCHNNF